MRRTHLAIALLIMTLTLVAFSILPALAATSIPGGATITSAKFSVYVDAVPWGASNTVNVHRVTANWLEKDTLVGDGTGVTWSNFAGAYDPAVASSVVVSSVGWQTFDVTALVQAWVKGTYPNYGILLEQGLVPFTEYYSSDYSTDPSLRPKMEICYAAAGGSSTCATIQRPAGATTDVVDAYISAQTPSTNYGNHTVLMTGLLNNYEKESLVLFYFTIAPSAKLGDLVWQDLNANGIQDAGEPGIAGVTVNLYDCATNVLVATTTTDASGNYLFSGLAAGSYYVGFVSPTGFVFSPANVGTDSALDSNADSSGKTVCVSLAAGETNLTVDAGLFQRASLGDFVWNDLNHNGIQDAGEPGIADLPVTLHNCAGDLVAGTTTDASGKYLFSNLAPGSYYVQFVVPAGYLPSPKDQGTDDAVDSDADLVSGKTACTDLVSGETDLAWDAGLYQTVSAGTGTPGYWFNHPDAWPVDSITIGGVTYTKDQAIPLMKAPTKGDVTYIMFQALVSAKLNVLIGNDSSCISSTILAADSWMATYGPVGSGVKAGGKTSPWKTGEPLYLTLDDYNNGLMCAAHRD